MGWLAIEFCLHLKVLLHDFLLIIKFKRNYLISWIQRINVTNINLPLVLGGIRLISLRNIPSIDCATYEELVRYQRNCNSGYS